MYHTSYSPDVSSAPWAQTSFGVQCVWVALACMYTYDVLYTYTHTYIYVPLPVHLVMSIVRVLYNHTAYIAKSK